MNEKIIEIYIEDYLTSESNTFVVFDGTANILYKGDLVHCYAYMHEFLKQNGFQPAIYSIESYNKLFNKIKTNE